MNGGSLGSSGRVYDVHEERDVIALLKAVRHSALDIDSKDEVRDVVFALSTEYDAALVAELAMLMAPLGVTLAGVEAEPTPATTEHTSAAFVHSGFAAGRAIPTFTKATPTVAPASADPTVAPAAPESVVTPTPEPEPAPVSTSETMPTAPVTETATPVSEPTTMSPAAPAPKNVVAESTSATETPAATDTETAVVDPLKRIQAIKHDINTLVGNPVNLIDATNEVGREYMNALLEAMKAVNAGTGVESAMARLEGAYTAAKESLAEVPTTPPTPEPAEPVATEPTLANIPEPVAAPATHPEPTPAAPTTTWGSEGTVTHTMAADQQVAKEHPEVVPTIAATTPQVTEPEPTPTKDITEPSTTPASVVSNSPTEQVAAPQPAPVAPLESVAAHTTPGAAPAPEPEPTLAAPADELMNETITSGLNQLLKEWRIFAASGLLRSGASGIEHPLYITLKDLPMNLVVAGRFDGATTEVKQSIHDYMNGWRYEQGLTHDLKETFEHYLRRVIKIIIDKHQKAQ